VIPRPAGPRKWPTKWRRAEGQGGQAGVAEEFDDPNEASEARARASEAELLAAAAAGKHEALRWLLDDVAPIVYGFVFARVGGDEATAEDLLQETLLEAVRSAATFRGESAVSTWLCTIARRRLARYYETERRAEVARGSLRLVDTHVAAGLGADLVERQDEVVRALGRLPALQRQVLVLKYLEELSVEDIAGQVSRSRVQVQSLLQRGREGLRRQLGAHGG
jgi:RNA polymerase sigma-70 factor (ECF subfamily)